MNAEDREDELETFLKRRRILLRSHLSALEPLEPSAELDRLILKQARLALLPTPPAVAAHPPPPHRGWAVPAGVVATVAVGLLLVVDLGVHALRTSVSMPALHDTSGVFSAQHADETASSDSDEDDPTSDDESYSDAYYPRLAANGPASAPIFEVVIRSARFVASRAEHSAEPASR